MAKNVADYIVDLLHANAPDFKTLHKLTTTDWKWLLNKEIEHYMIHIAYSHESPFYKCTHMDLNFKTYTDIIEQCKTGTKPKRTTCNDIYLDYHIPRTHHSYTYEQNFKIQTEIDILKREIDGHPNIIYEEDGTLACKIINPYLQELVDYCKSLGFNLYHTNTLYSDIRLYLSWSHWPQSHE